jgi:hypothetical protein
VAYLDNPAGRLLHCFEKARSVQPETPAVNGWARVFEIEDGDLRSLFARTAQLFELASKTRHLVESLTDADPEVILENFPQIEETLSNFTHLTNLRMDQFLAPLDFRSGQHTLKLCSSLLHRAMREPTLESSQVAQLLDQLNSLIGDVEDTDDLDAHTKEWVLARLQEVHEKLTNIDTVGVPDLEQSVDKLAGGLFGNRDRVAALSQSKISKKLVGLILALDLVLNIAANVTQIAGSNEQQTPSPRVEIIQQQFNIANIPALPPGTGNTDGSR